MDQLRQWFSETGRDLALGFPLIDFAIESWHFSAITTGRYINGNGHYQCHPPVIRRDHSYLSMSCFVARRVE